MGHSLAALQFVDQTTRGLEYDDDRRRPSTLDWSYSLVERLSACEAVVMFDESFDPNQTKGAPGFMTRPPSQRVASKEWS